MPWNISDGVEARRRFLADRLAIKVGDNMTRLCRRHGISRECGYQWWRRFKLGGWRDLTNHRTQTCAAEQLKQRWWPRLQTVRRRQADFGPKKLRWLLQQLHPREQPPSVRTLARWLERAGLVRRPKRRARPGPPVKLPGRLLGRCVHDVWTVDLKGSFGAADGHRINPLTVRDLASRYILCVRHVGTGGEARIGPVLRALFRRHGLPRALRMDNGAPFGALGPRGWTRLSASWIKLGIRLEYGRPRCPQDNAEHEQMHRVLKRRTTRPASVHASAQQRRFERWRQWYNHDRPHESLGMQVPASRYRRSPRPWPKAVARWCYPTHWERLCPEAKGRCQWRQRQRLIGQAFIHEELGGRPLGHQVLAVYFGPHLLGTLHAGDQAGLRPVQWRLKPVAGGAAPLPCPPRSGQIKSIEPTVSDVCP
jgi:putative transposase